MFCRWNVVLSATLFATLVLGSALNMSCVVARQNDTTTGASEKKQSPSVEGKWLITFIAPHGEPLKRVLTLDRDHTGQVTASLDAPVCPCVVTVISFKGDHLTLKITPQKRVPNMPAPASTIWEVKLTNDAMKGESYIPGISHPSSKFTGVRQAKDNPAANSTQN